MSSVALELSTLSNTRKRKEFIAHQRTNRSVAVTATLKLCAVAALS